MQLSPEWIIAVAAVVSPLLAALAAVFSVKSELRVVREIATSARDTAKRAHQRIDTWQSNHGR